MGFGGLTVSQTVNAAVRLLVNLPSEYSELDDPHYRNVVKNEFKKRAFQNRIELETLFNGWSSVPLKVDNSGHAAESDITACLSPKLFLYNQTRKLADPTAFQPLLGGEAYSSVRYEVVNGVLVCYHDRWLMAPSAGSPTGKRWTIPVNVASVEINVQFSIGIHWSNPIP